ncbi:MAG: CHASE3 domain-containing protein, partial [Acidobacteriaceae bacterium]|nr:CHASE3 domain-containing protein [Acidobacteriaceae bacterium]
MSLPGTPGTRLRLAILFAIPVAFSLLFFGVNTAAEHYDSRLLRLQVLNSSISTLRSVANDAEVGEHGFLLTGDDRYLLTLDDANTRLKIHSEGALNALEDSSLQNRATQLIDLVRKRVEEANRLVRVQRSSGPEAALEIVKSGASENTMQQIRSSTDTLQSDLRAQISQYLDRSRYLTHATFIFFLVGTLFMLVVLVWLYNSFLEYMHARDLAHGQLRELNAELERKVEERTKELQQFNEELQQFAYVASHDMQEPLRTITSFTQLLASRYKGHLDEDADEFIGYIVNSARRMTDLINGLLALVRLRKA